MITGEVLDLEMESNATRVIQLKFDRGDIDLQRLTFYQNNLMNLPTFMYGYIKFITNYVNEVFSVIEEEFQRARSGSYPTNMPGRFIDAIAVMSAEVRIFYIYATVQGFLKAEDALSYQTEDLEYIQEVIMNNYYDSKIQSPSTQILLALKWALENKRIENYEITACKDLDKLEQSEIENNVIMSQGVLGIRPTRLFEIYRDYCKEFNQSIIYKDGRELVAPLKKDCAIVVKREGKEERATHKLGYKTQKRFFHIYRDVYERICSEYEKF